MILLYVIIQINYNTDIMTMTFIISLFTGLLLNTLHAVAYLGVVAPREATIQTCHASPTPTTFHFTI